MTAAATRADRRPPRRREPGRARRRGRVRSPRDPLAGDLGGAADEPDRGLRHAHRAVCRICRRRLRPQLRATGAAAAVDRPGRAELAHRGDGGGQLARPGGGDLQPDPQRPGRAGAAATCTSSPTSCLVRAAGQARRAGRQRRLDPRAAGAGLAGGADPTDRPGLRRDPASTCSDSPATGPPRLRAERHADRHAAPRDAQLAAGALLDAAQRPVIWAGGGVLRAGAGPELRAARRAPRRAGRHHLHGQGRPAGDHPLAAGCGCDEAALQELLVRRRRRPVRRHRARRRDHRPVRAAVRRPRDPPRRRPGADRRHLPRAGARRRRQADAGRADRRALPAAALGCRRRGWRRCAARIRAGLEAQGRETELGLLRNDRAGAGPRRHHRLGHDDPRLLGRPASAAGGRAAVPVPARLRDARLRLAGGARRRHRPSRPAGAGGGRRRRPAVRAGRARNRRPAPHRGQAAGGRRRRLRDPARVPARRLRRDHRGRARRASTWPRWPRRSGSRSAPPPPTISASSWSWALAQPGPAAVVLRTRLAAAQPTA